MNWFDKKDEKGVMGKVHQLFSVPIIEFKFSKHSQYSLPNFPKGEKNPGKWQCSLYTTWPEVLPDDELVGDNIIKPLKNDLKIEINQMFDQLKISKKWDYDTLWYNYYYDNQGQEKHDHIASAGKPNSYWSGIYFHTVNNLSPTVFFNPSSLHKTQQFPKWEESLISSSYWDTWNLYPTDGDVILFPPYLSHFVPPSGNKEKMRFTFSFNLLLTQ